MVLGICHALVLFGKRRTARHLVPHPWHHIQRHTLMLKKFISSLTKTYHELDTSEVIKALAIIREEPHFKQFIEFREAQREEVIRHLGAETETNRHFLLTGKLEAIDQELDMIKTLS